MTRANLSADSVRNQARSDGAYLEINAKAMSNNFFLKLNGIQCHEREKVDNVLNDRGFVDPRVVIDFYKKNNLVDSYYSYDQFVVRMRNGMDCVFKSNIPNDLTDLLRESIGIVK